MTNDGAFSRYLLGQMMTEKMKTCPHRNYRMLDQYHAECVECELEMSFGMQFTRVLAAKVLEQEERIRRLEAALANFLPEA